MKICNKKMSFNDCELAILRMAVDNAEKDVGRKIVNSTEVKNIIKIVEDFLKRKKLICYGGTAINNLLPKDVQFYDRNTEVPDYDFFSYNALNDAKELANIYYSKGYTNIEAKSSTIHFGTYKVFVNYIPVADITYIQKEIFDALLKDSIRIAGILYAPPNFLRMYMYLELSRPAGATNRWEKVLKRLILLNKYYPLTTINCNKIEYQREMSDNSDETQIYEIVRKTFIDQDVVFFGGYAISLYSQYMPKKMQKKIKKIADFDVLTNEPEKVSEIIKERLYDINIKNVKIIKHSQIGELIPQHFEIKIGNDTIAFIYKPIACHSYNIIKIEGQNIRVATIDTMLSFYLAFLYVNKEYYKDFSDRILCMSKLLFDVQQKNRLEQTGILKRFSIDCVGHQKTLEEIRLQRTKKYEELKNNKNSTDYDKYFLNYKPNEHKKKTIKKTNKIKPKKNRTKKSFDFKMW